MGERGNVTLSGPVSRGLLARFSYFLYRKQNQIREKWPNLTTIPRKVIEKIYELKITDILVPHIRPEERLMAAQQQQLLQAANAQHMAAMVALEAMQNQAKVNIFNF